jgi:two-component system, LytTR family, response regulator
VNESLRVVIADDERPARSFLAAILRGFEDVTLVGEAENGAEAVEVIERTKPDLALLDLQMPEVDGLGVARLLKKNSMPLVAFVTAYDETVNRAQERLDRAESREEAAARLAAADEDYQAAARQPALERIPVRHQDEIVILPVKEVASIVADGELLHLTTARNETYTLSYRLKDLEARLNPAHFIRLGRGTLANVEMMRRVSPMPGGTYIVTLNNGQQLNVSRSQGRILREHLLKL